MFRSRLGLHPLQHLRPPLAFHRQPQQSRRRRTYDRHKRRHPPLPE
jgi:hypothetical protein